MWTQLKQTALLIHNTHSVRQFYINRIGKRIEAIIEAVEMKLLVKNTFTALRISLTCLTITGFYTRRREVNFILSYCFPFLTFMFMTGKFVYLLSILTRVFVTIFFVHKYRLFKLHGKMHAAVVLLFVDYRSKLFS